MTGDDMARLRALAREATPGPWHVFRETQGYPNDGQLYIDELEMGVGSESIPEVVADAAYIAAANPSTVLTLLDRLDVLEAALREIVAEGAHGQTASFEWVIKVAQSALANGAPISQSPTHLEDVK